MGWGVCRGRTTAARRAGGTSSQAVAGAATRQQTQCPASTRHPASWPPPGLQQQQQQAEAVRAGALTIDKPAAIAAHTGAVYAQPQLCEVLHNLQGGPRKPGCQGGPRKPECQGPCCCACWPGPQAAPPRVLLRGQAGGGRAFRADRPPPLQLALWRATGRVQPPVALARKPPGGSHVDQAARPVGAVHGHNRPPLVHLVVHRHLRRVDAQLVGRRVEQLPIGVGGLLAVLLLLLSPNIEGKHALALSAGNLVEEWVHCSPKPLTTHGVQLVIGRL